MEEDIKILEGFIEENKKRPIILHQAIKNLIARNKELEKNNNQLREYIFVAPNLDGMTATRYKSIQEEAYIRGREDERQRAKQIIEDNYISKSKIKEIVKELDERCIYPEKTSWYADLTVGEALFIKGFLKRELLEEE